MKLHANRSLALNTVTAYGPGWIEINAQRYAHAILVQPQGEVLPWVRVGIEALEADHFDALAAAQPEVVLLGTGALQRFPSPRITAGLLRQRIGVEAMDTGAACRTYNILMTEGRKVLAALLPI
jgi:uncharacterized protein